MRWSTQGRWEPDELLGSALIANPSGTIIVDTAGKPGVVSADVGLDAPRYESWFSVAGAAKFRCLWPKECRSGLYDHTNQSR